MKDIGIFEALTDAMEHLQGKLKKELREQGHYLTGALHNSIDYKVTRRGQTVVIAEMYSLDYGLIMEVGVKPNKIPYGGRGGGASGGTSKYIQGLVTFFQKRGLDERGALSAAFATANVQKREGMPTNGSFAFSANGRRTGFVSETLENHLEIVGKILAEKTGYTLQINFNENLLVEKITFQV